jgi:hypothetical protein
MWCFASTTPSCFHGVLLRHAGNFIIYLFFIHLVLLGQVNNIEDDVKCITDRINKIA